MGFRWLSYGEKFFGWTVVGKDPPLPAWAGQAARTDPNEGCRLLKKTFHKLELLSQSLPRRASPLLHLFPMRKLDHLL